MKTNKVVVDGANVAYAEVSRAGDPQVSNLVAIRRVLEDKGFEPIVIVDASLRHEVDDARQLEALFDEPTFRQAPAGADADYFILETAHRLDAYVLSNDEFEEYSDRYPWIRERRVPLMIIQGEVELYEPKLGDSGGTRSNRQAE
jgi:hypothetical protein